jgi:hypothetical protein
VLATLIEGALSEGGSNIHIEETEEMLKEERIVQKHR